MRNFINQDVEYLFRNLINRRKFPELSNDSMSGEGFSKKLSELCCCKNVLEFGTGGSTLLLAKVANYVISIDSDKKFLNYIKGSHAQLNGNTLLLYANIGLVKTFGQPISFFKILYKKKYRLYTDIFFKNQKIGFIPDVIFIDGRFRVWCAVQSTLHISKDFVIIFDDYFSRPEYWIVENFLGRPEHCFNDSAIFYVKAPNINVNELEYDKFQFDYR